MQMNFFDQIVNAHWARLSICVISAIPIVTKHLPTGFDKINIQHASTTPKQCQRRIRFKFIPLFWKLLVGLSNEQVSESAWVSNEAIGAADTILQDQFTQQRRSISWLYKTIIVIIIYKM